MSTTDDKRWSIFQKKIAFNNDFIFFSMQCKYEEGIVIYDSSHIHDNFHAEDILNNTNAKAIKCIGCGHMAGKMFNKLYGLRRLLSEIKSENFCYDSCVYEIDRKSQNLAVYKYLTLNKISDKIELIQNFSYSFLNSHIVESEILSFEKSIEKDMGHAALLYHILISSKNVEIVKKRF